MNPLAWPVEEMEQQTIVCQCYDLQIDDFTLKTPKV